MRDTIEYLMPSLMRIFASSDKFCRFVGRNAEDVKGAEQATELVNFVLTAKTTASRFYITSSKTHYSLRLAH